MQDREEIVFKDFKLSMKLLNGKEYYSFYINGVPQFTSYPRNAAIKELLEYQNKGLVSQDMCKGFISKITG